MNIVLHIWGGEFGPFLPPKNGSTALLGPPKGLVLAPKGPFLGPLRSSEGLGGQIWSQLLPIGPAGLVTWLPHTLAWCRPSSGPPGAQKGPFLAQNVPFGGPRGPRRAPEDQIWSQLPSAAPPGLNSWLPHTVALYRPSSEPPGAPKGPVLAQNVSFGGQIYF